MLSVLQDSVQVTLRRLVHLGVLLAWTTLQG